jgi:hypothetical protein
VRKWLQSAYLSNTSIIVLISTAVSILAFSAWSGNKNVSATGSDITPPVVNIASPGEGTVLPNLPITINANASDDMGLFYVAFSVDGVTMINDSAPPFSASWAPMNYTEGAHSISATAKDLSGNVSTVTINVILDKTPPAAPSDLSAGVTADNYVSLGWNASGDDTVVQYGIQRNSTIIAKISASNTSYTDTALTPGVTYKYTVTAYDAAGNHSIPSNTVVVNTDTIPPGVPTGLNAKAIAQNQFNLSWQQSSDTGGSGVKGYKIFRDGVYLAGTTAASYVDNTVTGGNTYTYTVLAYDGAGNSSTESPPLVVTAPKLHTLVFLPAADTYISSKNTKNNYGTSKTLITDGNPDQDILLKFNVSGIGAGLIQNVNLRLYVTAASTSGGSVRKTTNNWLENTVSWTNRPTAELFVYGSLGAVQNGSWAELSLPNLITGDGTYSMQLDTTSPDSASYAARETTNAPQLVITILQ